MGSTRTAVRAAAAALVVAVLLPACTGPGPGPAPTTVAPSPTPTGAATTPVPAPSAPAGAPLHAPGDEEVTGAPVPVWDDASRAQARTVAGEAMRLYARPAADPEQWWAELSGLLTPGAQQDYQWVQPASIPATTVSGEPVVAEEPSVYLARVDVATDVGVYQVLLSRQDGPTDWLVERITPPEGAG
ncbi:hypothetical protein [Georgenia subflava]|uniref:DUF4019 domain-containing protein n=1 Tax=Georgenia subflava TaxID=1622177 RepID=A0A6N7EDL9_9MICO|nr:hypothetical protein [Georgenia subflava]MPV36100.1 hypothetical protein [Georgenia subflava]